MAASHDLLQQILIWLVPVLPAIILHEYAHGWVAGRLGDPTARLMGRLSLNPLRHIDPVGTVFLPGLMLLLHMPFVFGWAKPVPVDFHRLRHGRFGTLCVALAGPAANLLMMFGWLLVLFALAYAAQGRVIPSATPMGLAAQIALAGVAINLALMLLNLIPIPPLDGGRVVGALLPGPLSRAYMRIERYGLLILLVLIATGAFSYAVTAIINFVFARLGIT